MKSTQADSTGLKRRGAWLWSVLPLNAGLQGFGTLVPLYIISLGGNVVHVGLFTTLYNVVLIPSSIFWGRVTDRLAKRRLFFIITSAGATAVFLAMFLYPDLNVIGVLYGVLGFVVSANAVSSNLLVMETAAKKNWVSSYSRLSLVSSVGSIIGLGVGTVWVGSFPLGGFLVFCAGATCVAMILSYYLISEPAVPLETGQLSFNPANYPSRIYQGVTFFVHHLVVSRGMVKDAIRLVQASRAGAISGRALLFMSTFLFSVATTLLNTSFTPFLVGSGVTDEQVFIITLVNQGLQTGLYPWMGGLVSRLGGVRVGPYAVIVRTTLYMVIALSVLAFRGSDLFLLSSLSFGLIGATYAFWNSSTSVVLFSNLGPARQGSLLGGYAALGAFGSILGSLFTGYISFYQGYSTTFSVAAVVMLASFFVLEGALKHLGYVSRQNP